jgi:hypothetical protein
VASDRPKTIVVEHLPNLFRVHVVEARKLHALVPQFRDGSERAGHVASQIRSNRIELQRNRDFLSAIVLR